MIVWTFQTIDRVDRPIRNEDGAPKRNEPHLPRIGSILDTFFWTCSCRGTLCKSRLGWPIRKSSHGNFGPTRRLRGVASTKNESVASAGNQRFDQILTPLLRRHSIKRLDTIVKPTCLVARGYGNVLGRLLGGFAWTQARFVLSLQSRTARTVPAISTVYKSKSRARRRPSILQQTTGRHLETPTWTHNS